MCCAVLRDALAGTGSFDVVSQPALCDWPQTRGWLRDTVKLYLKLRIKKNDNTSLVVKTSTCKL